MMAGFGGKCGKHEHCGKDPVASDQALELRVSKDTTKDVVQTY